MILRAISVVGMILFGSFFILTYHITGYVEVFGKEFIKNKIKEKTHEKIDSIKLQSKDSILKKIPEKFIIKIKKNWIPVVR